VFVFLVLPGFRVVQQYEKGVVFLLGKITGVREPGLTWIVPYFMWMRKIDLRTITMPIPPQKIITKDNVSVDISAVAYYQIQDPIKSIVAIENVMSAINQISQTTVRNIVGRFQLDEILSERDVINGEIRKVLDTHTESWGVVVSVVEIKDIELPENMQRAMAKQAEAEREKRAKIIAAEGELLASQKLGEAADVIAAHPIALQLRNLQTMAEISIEKNSTIIFPAQLMSSVGDLKKFITREQE
jgi:regulator of protease activity HflC (stomatin/prohibitin superfamily)